MAHTTSVYYRDRLGFEPETEGRRQYSQQQTTPTKTQYMSSTSAVASSSSRYSSSHIGNGSGNGGGNGSAPYEESMSSHHIQHDQRHQKSITAGSGHGGGGGSGVPGGAASQGMYEENLTKFKGRFLLVV